MFNSITQTGTPFLLSSHLLIILPPSAQLITVPFFSCTQCTVFCLKYCLPFNTCCFICVPSIKVCCLYFLCQPHYHSRQKKIHCMQRVAWLRSTQATMFSCRHLLALQGSVKSSLIILANAPFCKGCLLYPVTPVSLTTDHHCRSTEIVHVSHLKPYIADCFHEGEKLV